MIPKSLHDMTVLVTGGSRGIGAAIVEHFASKGMNVVLHYYQSYDCAMQVSQKCTQYDGFVYTVKADIREKTEIEGMRNELEKQRLMPDIVVNNAGVSHFGLFTEMDETQWDQLMAINLKGMFFCSQVFAPHMIRQRYGRIINISSIWGDTGASCEVAYSASKGGVNAMTKAMAKELAPSGITVNAVAPGVVDTQMLAHLEKEEKLALQEEIPMGRFALPTEIASLVYYLSLPESSYITGQIISPNGGWHV